MAFGLLQTSRKKEEEEVVATSPPQATVAGTAAAMGPTPTSVVPKMRQKTAGALSIRGGPGLMETERKTQTAIGGKQIPSGLLSTSKRPVMEPYDPTPNDPVIEKLTTTSDAGTQPKDIVNFLFGGEMGIIGAKWDNEGFSWDWENAKQQWSEQPLWINLASTVSLFGTAAFPVGRAAYLTTKVGRVGEALGVTGSHADEVMRWGAMGLMDSSHAKSLTFDQRKMFRMMERNYDKTSARLDRVAKAQRGEPLGTKERMFYEFEKRFANTHDELGRSSNARMKYHERLDSLWKNENLGRFFVDIPDDTNGPGLMQHWMHQMDPQNVPKPTGLTPKDMAWADNLADAMKKHQLEGLDEGYITQQTFDKMPMHVPAQYKGTPEPDMSTSRTFLSALPEPKQYPGQITQGMEQRKGLARVLFGKDKPTAKVSGTSDYVAVRVQAIPRLDSPTLQKRAADLPEIYQRLQSGQLITSPKELTTRGYITDRLLINNFKYVRDAAMDQRYAVSHSDIMTKFTDKTGFFDRAAAKKAGFVSLDSVGGRPTEILGRMIQKKGGSLGVNGELPWIRKEIFDEAFGAHTGLFAQAQNAINFMDIVSSSFKTMKTVTSIPTHFNNMAGTLSFVAQGGMNPFSPRNLDIFRTSKEALDKISAVWKIGKASGIPTREIMDKSTFNLGSVTIDKKLFDLNEELLDPVVRELFEENSLDSLEGAAHLTEMLGRAKEGTITKSVLKGAMKVKDLMQVNDKVKLFDKMTKAYTYEDMVPKIGYYLHMRSQGLTRQAAVIETGRRLPMYNNVGSAIIAGRKTLFPWATFTTEAARITKNNLMDHPLRMMPWLQLPGIMQSLAAGMEGRSYEDVQEARRGLPLFGQTPTSLMTSAGTQAKTGGAATGALMGATMGLMRGGAPGAIAGGVAGGLAGGFGTGQLSKMAGENSDEIRGAMMEWLPHAAFMLTSTSPDFEWTARTALEQVPSQPLAILKPFMDVAMGQTAWGQEIGNEGFVDSMGKSIAGFLGLMSPPIFQKYGWKVTTPDVSVSEQLLGKALPGDITNMSRFLIDTGIKIDPATGKPGSLSQDFVLNNFGMWKSYAAKPETRLANESIAQKNLEKTRTYLAKNLDYYLANGQDTESLEILGKVQRSFAKQHMGDPRTAQDKYDEWLKRKLKKIGQHPRLSSWSAEELKTRMRTASSFAREARGQARDEMVKFIQDEQRIRNMGSAEVQGLFNRNKFNKKSKEEAFNKDTF